MRHFLRMLLNLIFFSDILFLISCTYVYMSFMLIDFVVAAVTRVIAAGARVTGVTSLGDDVFVALWDRSQQIAVYNAVTLTLQRRLSVPGLGYSAGLTVSSDKNVMVVIQREHKLQQFTTHGTLLQTIQLQSDIEWLQGVIQLFSGQFVISLRGLTHHRVCLLDDKGAVVQSYGSTQGSERTKLYCPKGIAVDKHGNILVADNRLLVLDPSLTSVHEMSVSVDRRRKEPYSLWYDKSRGRLLISESYGKRVIIIDHLKDFTSLACVHLPA